MRDHKYKNINIYDSPFVFPPNLFYRPVFCRSVGRYIRIISTADILFPSILQANK